MDIWNDPITEGVTEANPPATPSEEVAPAQAEKPVIETVETTVETSGSETPKEQVKDEATEPSPDESVVKREGRRIFFESQKLGGWDQVKEAHELQTALQDPSLDTQAKLQKLYQAAPRAIDDLKRDLFFQYWDNPAQQDIFAKELFGLTVAEAKQRLGAAVAPPSTPDLTAEQLDKMTNEEVLQWVSQRPLPAEVQAKLQKLEELEGRVTKLSEVQEQVQQQKVQQLGQEFVSEAMSPVVRMMEDAGLKVTDTDSPDEKIWKTEIWDTIIQKTYNDLLNSPENKALADDIQHFIEKGDRQSAWAKMRVAQAKAELAASKRIPIYTSQRQKQRDAQTQVLGKERPPLISGGQNSFGTALPELSGAAVWNDASDAERWKEIADSLG